MTTTPTQLPTTARSVACLIATTFFIGIASGPAIAEEGGSGHYLAGSMASFIDAVPPKEVFLMRLNVVNYDGSFDKSQPLPIAGLTAVGASAQ